MIIQLRKKYQRTKVKPTDWHVFWCLIPRVIDNHFVWLHRAERRVIGKRYDSASGLTYPVYEYRLINWYMI